MLWLSSVLRTSSFSVLALLMCFMVPSGHSQTISGTIVGTAVDPSGAAIPDAEVTLSNDLTNETRRDVTNRSGEFVFPALQPGTYTLSVRKSGFDIERRTGLQLQTNQRLSLKDVTLTIGQTSQTLTVHESTSAVNTESADIAPELTQTQIRSVPVVGRDVMALLRILPGVGTIPTGPSGEIDQRDPTGSGASNGGQYGSFTPNIGGYRLFWNTAMVDGQVGSNPDFPGLFMSAMSMDAVSEAKILSQNYLADYGRNPGPSIILVSKSGTSAFHGSLYYYLRNEDFNANDFFNNRDGLKKPLYRFNTQGGTIGGPLFIPKLFNKSRSKLFFFYAEEDWQTKLPQGLQQVTVPSALERKGDFSQSVDPSGALRVITDPTTHQPYPGNQVPKNLIDPNGLKLLNLFPLPNVTNTALTNNQYNYQWQDSCDIPKRLQTLKLDYHPTDKDTISALPRRWWSDTRSFTCNTIGYGGNLPIFYNHYRYSTDSIVVNWTHTFSSSIVNEFGTGFTGEKEEGLPEAIGGKTTANYFDPILRRTIGFTAPQLFAGANQYGFLPQALFNNVPGITGSPNLTADGRLPDNQGYERFHLTDNLHWTKGDHTMTFGFYFERNWATDGVHAPCFNGCFDFTADPRNPFNSGYDFSNALLGNFNSYQESNQRLPYQARDKVFEWFAQDTWKVTRKFTLTGGLRFSWATPWYVGKGTGAEFSQSAYNPSQVPPLYRPGFDANGNSVAINPVTGAAAPDVYVGAFTGPSTYSGTLLSTDSSVPKGFRNQTPVQVAPRIGFAYDPFGDGKTSIRAGFGVMKQNVPTYNTFFWSMISNPPVQIESQIFYGKIDNLLQTSGVVFPSNTSAIQRDFKVPSLYNYSLGIQRQIGNNTTLSASYVGNVARHLLQTVDINEVPYGSEFLPQNQNVVTGTPLNDNFFRPIPGYGSIPTLVNGGVSNYNSLQVSLNRQLATNFSFTTSYTWSHALGTGSNDGDQLATYKSWRVWNYGPTLFDQRQTFVGTWTWDLPHASKLLPNPFVKAVFDNWELSGLLTVATGLPQSIGLSTISNENIAGGGDGARVVITGPVRLSHGDRSFNRWFNTGSIALPAVGTSGNAPVYSFYGPGQCQVDATIMRRFPLWGEHRALEFRTELYNALNHTQYQSVNNQATFDSQTGQQVNGTFGQVVSTRAPRVIQFSLRVEF